MASVVKRRFDLASLIFCDANETIRSERGGVDYQDYLGQI